MVAVMDMVAVVAVVAEMDMVVVVVVVAVEAKVNMGRRGKRH